MRTSRQNLGQKGEDLAVGYLVQKGYTVLERNFRIKRAEIDIVCMHENELVLVEVKSVRASDWGCGEERINVKKRKMLIRASYALVDLYQDYSGKNIRFDVIVIDFLKYPASVHHYPSAFWQEPGEEL
jgi:putative endonuclease